MGIVHAARDEQAVVSLKLIIGGHASTLFRHDKDLVGLDAERGVVFPAGRAEVTVEDLAKGSLLGGCVGVRLISLEDDELDEGGVDGGLVVLTHD